MSKGFHLSATKAIRDLTANRGRSLLLIAANAVGLTAVVTLVTGFSLLSREIERSFVGSQPASAIVKLSLPEDRDPPNLAQNSLGSSPRELLALARSQSGMLAAELRRTVTAVVERPAYQEGAPSEQVTVMLFVIDDFTDLRVSTFSLEEGSFPGPGEIAIEQSALGFLRTEIGSDLVTNLRGSGPLPLRVGGVIHDPGQAPAWMEGLGYGYISRPTLELLLPPGQAAAPDELLLAMERGPKFSREGIADTTQQLRDTWTTGTEAETSGVQIHNVFIPPPGDHPHQGQMDALRLTLLVFAGFALVLAGVLTLSTLQAFLQTQISQIATLKTLGARRSRIASIYGLSVGILGIGGALLGVPLGFILGREYARLAGGFLNLRMSSLFLDPETLLGVALAALLLPLAVAAPVVLKATGRSVRENLSAISPRSGKPSRLQALAAFSSGKLASRPLAAYALRNALRHPRRMALSLCTLVAANALLLTSANVGQAWLQMLAEADRVQTHSATLRVALEPQPRIAIMSGSTTPGISSPGAKETLAIAQAALNTAPSFDAEVWRSFGVNSKDVPGQTFPIQEIVVPTEKIDLEVLEGRWLFGVQEAGTDSRAPLAEAPSASAGGPQTPEHSSGLALVLNHALAYKLGASLGDELTFWSGSSNQRSHPSSQDQNETAANFTVVGIVKEMGSPGGAYVQRAPETWKARSHLVLLGGADADADSETLTAQRGLARDATQRLQAAGLEVLGSRASATRNQGLYDHVVIFRTTLALMAGLLGVVGALGLLSAIGLNVLERTREIGVLRALGALHSTVSLTVMAEGLALGLAAFFAAAVLSVPLSVWAGARTGSVFVLAPLPPGIALWAYVTALLGTLLLAALASWVPARSLRGRTVTRTLNYV